MQKINENSDENLQQRVLLCSVDTGEYDNEVSLDELEELTDTAGGKVIARVTQKRPAIDTATCMGVGRLNEAAEICEKENIDLVIFDRELTAVQIRNIEKILDVDVIDRTMLILDIFAQRANSGEGKIQVEIARLKYQLPRLTGAGHSLSRQGGGIGARGAGESQLEMDKRYIRSRIDKLSSQLKDIEKRRNLMRKRRKKDGILTAAIVGYTNVGKSTLLNTLTNAGVLAENKLFATLETTSRSIELPDGRNVMLIDTVGLIRRLPHNLVEAFKSTLEEAANADVIIHLCDASSDECSEQAKVTEELLQELGCGDIPVVTVLNKCDKVPYIDELDISDNKNTVKISAKNGQGIDNLLRAISESLKPTTVRMKINLPYEEGGLLNEIRKDGKVFSEEYTENGISAEVLADIRICGRLEKYRIERT